MINVEPLGLDAPQKNKNNLPEPPRATLEGPPLPISVWQCCPVGSAAFWFVVYLVLTRIIEKTQTGAQKAENHPTMASGGLLDGSWGAPVLHF